MKMDIVLASNSPRRKELLSRLTNDFTQMGSRFNEDEVVYKGNIEDYVIEVAEGKALEVGSRVENSIIIGCDTIVESFGQMLGKPKNEEEGINSLKTLSGKSHFVYTGIVIINSNSNEIVRGYEKTIVTFGELEEEEIKKYILTGEYKDKAGSYGIQGYGGLLVEKIEGCYYNVVGLPIRRLYKMLKLMGVNL